MDIYAYGEDALTLWALKNKLGLILGLLNDTSSLDECRAFFRPSFGRGKGAVFGEFDFILLSKHSVYLGESKWDRSSEKIEAGDLTLRMEQQRRHIIFKFYLTEWAFGQYKTWSEFEVYNWPRKLDQGSR